jgi:hypothetical protein
VLVEIEGAKNVGPEDGTERELKEAGRGGEGGKATARFPVFNVTFYIIEERCLVDDYGRVHVRWKFLSHTTVAGADCCPAGVGACNLLKRREK